MFERAYADFICKRDARWFLKKECAHPRTALLKSQIAYRGGLCQTSVEQLKQYKSSHIEPVTNLVAAASRCSNPIDIKLIE